MRSNMASSILNLRPYPTVGPLPTKDPFLFCVYHKDHYPPAANPNMEAPFRGNGQDFDPNQPYRMYHGDFVPGFPQHPHRGFETITATIEGIVDHADSAGNAGRYGMGDVQWMTAGKGIVHCEMFPLLKQQEDNPLRFFQIWLNLPAKNKMVDPSFAMFWSHDVPKYKTNDGNVSVAVWAGDYFGKGEEQNTPPPNSWATDKDNDVAILHIVIQPGGKFELPKANTDNVNRSLFLVEGLDGVVVDGESILTEKVVLEMDATKDIVTLELPDEATVPTEFLMLQGKPIDEPVVQHGPFVMNTRQEIQQAFTDYSETQFGGWQWARDDVVFPKHKDRFALVDGKETYPEHNCPGASTT